MASRLADIGIRSLEDLLFYFPLRYQDRTKITAIGSLRDQVDAVVEAEVREQAAERARHKVLAVATEVLPASTVRPAGFGVNEE